MQKTTPTIEIRDIPGDHQSVEARFRYGELTAMACLPRVAWESYEPGDQERLLGATCDSITKALSGRCTSRENREIVASVLMGRLYDTVLLGRPLRWMAELREWADGFPQRDHVDDSRESIYRDRG